jgi:hypothetical protein
MDSFNASYLLLFTCRSLLAAGEALGVIGRWLVHLFYPTDQLLPLECRMFDASHLSLTPRATPATIAKPGK